jgi:beta-lactamase class A
VADRVVSLQAVVDRAVAATPQVSWSIVAGPAVFEPDRQLRTASIGKILLLLETARQIEDGSLDPDELLGKDPALAVADSGLWQHLSAGALPVTDLAVLIAAVSDNYATNVLLQRVGLDRLPRLRRTALNDRVRNRRGPQDPPTLSHGTARELADLIGGIGRGEVISPAVSARVDGWLALNTDLSMVAAGLDLDPLAHTGPALRNKTGTDDGIRADVGRVGPTSYAVLANWDPAAGDATAAVLSAMRSIGTVLDQTGL